MNTFLKQGKITIDEVVGLLSEVVLAMHVGEGTDDIPCKKLTMTTKVVAPSGTSTMYTVYDRNQTPIMNTAVLKMAVDRYNALSSKGKSVPEATEVVS